jgi:hypothetical protein
MRTFLLSAIAQVVDHEYPDSGNGKEGLTRPLFHQMRRCHGQRRKGPALTVNIDCPPDIGGWNSVEDRDK